MKSCIVKGCISGQVDRFPFPADRPALNDAWIKALQNYQELDIDYRNFFVCPKHFSKNDFFECNENSFQLNSNAVPSLFPESPTQGLFNQAGIFLCKEEVDIEDLRIDFLKESENYSNEHDGIQNQGTSRYFVHKEETRSKDLTSGEEAERVSQEFSSVGDCEGRNAPVIEDDVYSLQLDLLGKKSELEKSQDTLQSMLNIFNRQKETISKLKIELATLERSNSFGIKNTANDDYLSKEQLAWLDQGNLNGVDLQVFCISLYYFSPNVYAYMSSIIPNFPSKRLIADWITSGLASKIFPHGVLDVNKINLS